jgi:hypothetical protein
LNIIGIITVFLDFSSFALQEVAARGSKYSCGKILNPWYNGDMNRPSFRPKKLIHSENVPI